MNIALKSNSSLLLPSEMLAQKEAEAKLQRRETERQTLANMYGVDTSAERLVGSALLPRLPNHMLQGAAKDQPDDDSIEEEASQINLLSTGRLAKASSTLLENTWEPTLFSLSLAKVSKNGSHQC